MMYHFQTVNFRQRCQTVVFTWNKMPPYSLFLVPSYVNTIGVKHVLKNCSMQTINQKTWNYSDCGYQSVGHICLYCLPRLLKQQLPQIYVRKRQFNDDLDFGTVWFDRVVAEIMSREMTFWAPPPPQVLGNCWASRLCKYTPKNLSLSRARDGPCRAVNYEKLLALQLLVSKFCCVCVCVWGGGVINTWPLSRPPIQLLHRLYQLD